MGTEAANTSPKLDSMTRLAYERTRVAYNRTVMAGVRTATSLITFGFAFYKFFQLDTPGAFRDGQLIGAREFGIWMIVIGLLSLVFATLEYYRDMKSIRTRYPDMPRSTAGVVAGLVAALGVLALTVALLRG